MLAATGLYSARSPARLRLFPREHIQDYAADGPKVTLLVVACPLACLGALYDSKPVFPTITGSLTELTTILTKKVTAEEVNAAMKAAANESFGYTEDEIVSSDIIGISYGSLFDATQTKVMTQGDVQLVKTVAWYDNEMSYVSQLVRTVKYFASKIK